MRVPLPHLLPRPFCGRELEELPDLSTRFSRYFAHPVTEDDDSACYGETRRFSVRVTPPDDENKIEQWNRRPDTARPTRASAGDSSAGTAGMPRELLAKVIDDVFGGAIEDAAVIEDIYAAIKRHETPPEFAFAAFQKVEKATGYQWPGVVVSAFLTLEGADRYVVECTAEGVTGALHIFAPNQLIPAVQKEDQA